MMQTSGGGLENIVREQHGLKKYHVMVYSPLDKKFDKRVMNVDSDLFPTKCSFVQEGNKCRF